MRRRRGRTRTSLSVFTLPRMPATCASFWLSSSLSTASLYWPLRFGVAGLNPLPGLLPPPTPSAPPPPLPEYPYP